MKIKFISNACAIFESSKGTKILSDPWIENGVFDGSWCHIHKLETKVEDLQNIDGIYLSHIHQDHYDERNFHFPLDIPIFILDHKFNYIHKNLKNQGYTNIIKIKDSQSYQFKDIKITLFAPFVKHAFFNDQSEIGNLIDSALVLECDGKVVFNANDNTPVPESCLKIKEIFGHVDFAMLNYNNAGPYPSCFNNFSLDEKKEEHARCINRNIDLLTRNLQALKPTYFMPFAGAYVLGGKLSQKNDYLGTITWDDCIETLKKDSSLDDVQCVALREKQTFDLEEGKAQELYTPLETSEIKNYIKEELAQIKYPYEMDEHPSLEILKNDLHLAKKKVYDKIELFKLQPDMNVYIKLDDTNKFQVISSKKPKGEIECSLDLRLLRRILDKKSHWNDAEIGCHIDFNRVPNYYSPDIHTLLQFFHLE